MLGPGQTFEWRFPSCRPLGGLWVFSRVTLAFPGWPSELRSDADDSYSVLPPFMLESKTVESRVVNPLEVHVRPLREVRASTWYPVQEVVRVFLRNPSGSPLDLSGGTLEVASFHLTVDRPLVLEPWSSIELLDALPSLGRWSGLGSRWRDSSPAVFRHRDWASAVASLPFRVVVAE